MKRQKKFNWQSLTMNTGKKKRTIKQYSKLLNVGLLSFVLFSRYNFAGFDIANHFCEWTYDYSHSEYPFFTFSPDQYPTLEQVTSKTKVQIETHCQTAKAVHWNVPEREPRVKGRGGEGASEHRWDCLDCEWCDALSHSLGTLLGHMGHFTGIQADW